MKGYERLTDKTKTELLLDCHDCPYCGVEYLYDCHIKIANCLAELEDKIENGTLIELPCKVGDTVYQTTRDFVSEYKIKGFHCFENGNIFFEWKCIKGIYYG